jgi:hypothetical protein
LTASFDGTTFSVPETGDYDVSGHLFFTTSLARGVEAFINGTTSKRISTNNTSDNHDFNGKLYLNKGDTFVIRVTANGGTLSNNTDLHHIHITKISSPQTMRESEHISARYTSNAGQSIPSASLTIINFEDKVDDSHGRVTTGAAWKFTSGTNAKYEVTVKATLNGDTGLVAPEAVYIDLYVNGVFYSRLDYDDVTWQANNNTKTMTGSDDVTLTSNDYIDVRIYQASGAAITMVSSAGNNGITIKRIK